MPAVADGLSDLLEVATEKVVEDFFKGTGYFEPGMPPCVEIGSIVGAVGRGTEVVDEVARGHDGELVVEYEAHEEDGLVVFLARIAVVVAHVKQMRTITA